MLDVLATTLARLPNSSMILVSTSFGGGTIDCVLRTRYGCGGGSGAFSFSFFDPRRKLRPRIDLRPLFRSPGESALSWLGEGVATILPPVDLREKKGMPEGVRRGLRRLERERPGEVVMTEGGGLVFMCAFDVVVVLLLLTLDVRGREEADAVLSLLKLLRILELVEADDDSCESRETAPVAKPAISFAEAAILREPIGSDLWLEKDELRFRALEARRSL